MKNADWRHASWVRSRWLAPLLIWLLGGLFFAAAARHEHLAPATVETWARWDSGSYLSIAADGYKVWMQPALRQGREVQWSGNTAWFPLYPLFLKALTRLGMSTGAAAWGLVELFWFLTLMVLWNIYLDRQPAGVLALLLASVFPGAIYYHALFPISMTLFFMLSYMALLLKKRFWSACLFGLAAGSAYTSGFYLSVAVLAWMWRQRAEPALDKRSCFAAAIAPIVGAVGVLCLQRVQTGSWDSFFRVWELQRYNGWSLVRLKQMLYIPTVLHPTRLTQRLVLIQSLSVAAVVGYAAVGRRRIPPLLSDPWTDASAGRRLVLGVVLLYWIAPHASPYRLSWYRAESLLFPLVALLGGMPRLWQWIIFFVWTPLAWLMALQFFRGILV